MTQFNDPNNPSWTENTEVAFFAQQGEDYFQQMDDAELETISKEYRIQGIPPRPFTEPQRQRLISTIMQIQRQDYIYGGAPPRRFPQQQVHYVEGNYVIQWDIDGPWMDLQGYERYADAESAVDDYLRYYANSGLEREDFRIVDRNAPRRGRG